METEADRLASLIALGGVEVTTPVGSFVAIFETPYAAVADGPALESITPQMTCRTSDVLRVRLQKGQTLTVPDGTTYRLVRHDPDDTGMSTLHLKK